MCPVDICVRPTLPRDGQDWGVCTTRERGCRCSLPLSHLQSTSGWSLPSEFKVEGCTCSGERVKGLAGRVHTKSGDSWSLLRFSSSNHLAHSHHDELPHLIRTAFNGHQVKLSPFWKSDAYCGFRNVWYTWARRTQLQTACEVISSSSPVLCSQTLLLRQVSSKEHFRPVS